MRLAFSIVALGLGLTACIGAPSDEAVLEEKCTALFTASSKSAEEISSFSGGASVEVFCSCYAQSLATSGTDIELHKTVLGTMVNTMGNGGLDIERVAEQVENAIDSGEITAFNENQLQQVGEDLEGIAETMEGQNGTCSA